MNKLFKYTLPMVALCGALASCSDDTTSGGIVDPNHVKELIALSGNDNGVTRAALTRAGFSSATKVALRIKAEYGANTRYTTATATAAEEKTIDGISLSELSYDSGSERYWDDAFGRDSKLTIYALAIPGLTEGTTPTWTETDWTAVDASTNPNWYTGTESTTVSWNVSTEQSATTMPKEDLTYSNNICSDKNLGKGGRYTYKYENNTWTETKFADGPLTWTPKTTTEGETSGKFDRGHLVFNHALAWIEINLKEGAGYNNKSADDFKWTMKDKTDVTQNITLTGFNTEGSFDVAKGEWDKDKMKSAVITLMDEETGTPDEKTTRQLQAYVLPGTDLYAKTDNVVEFEIDNSKYYVTGQQIANAIRSYYKSDAGKNAENASEYQNFTTIESGKHYVINLTVAKKGINDITAAIIDWETVNSDDAKAKNTYPEFTLDDRGTKLVDSDKTKFNLYRATQTASDYITGTTEPNYKWDTGYGTAATKKYGNSLWKTEWYWENNKTYYHFRAAGYTENDTDTPTITINSDETADPKADYFEIKSGALEKSDYKDYIWGAPFKKQDGKLTYSTTDGFDNSDGTTHQITQAIGATDSHINMRLFHMTSQITVNVMTTTDASKLALKKDDEITKVEILNFLPDGKVLMGNGLVLTTSGTRKDVAMTEGTYVAGDETNAANVNGYSYGIVPQSLAYTGGTIGFRITTPDGNQYIVKDLSTCTATVSTNSLVNTYTAVTGGGYIIDAWYPNYKYTYNVTIKKTGIDHITAAVVDWETVTGDLGTIDLEN